jgi:hypothetical protein
MAEPSYTGLPNKPSTPLVRLLSRDMISENWSSIPGFLDAWAEEYWNGSGWARQYHIKGTGAPSTSYDSYKTIGSEYMNYDTGEAYRCKSLNGTLTWCLCADIILQTEGDDNISNIVNLAMGTLVQDTDAKLYIKSAAGLTVGTSELVGGQSS